MYRKEDSVETLLIHAGELEGGVEGALVLPVFQSSTYRYSGEESYEELRYVRLSNTPNHRVLHEKLAALEGGEAALVCSSGMAAISTTLLTLLKPGDHMLIQRTLYGGTDGFVENELAELGIKYDFVDTRKPEEWNSKYREETRLIYVEAISNPLMQVGDLGEVVRFAREKGILSVIDNTFATPINFRPLTIGFDLVLHSVTKYLNGHSDLVAGAVIGSQELITRIRRRSLHLGGSADPHTCFLIQRGLKTLALRVRYQNQSALAIARFLKGHAAIREVHYPGLEDHPDYEIASKLFSSFGGMLSFELKSGYTGARKLIDNLRIPVEAPSLGGPESLITLPVTTSHSSVPVERRNELGITDGLIRLSVGLEGVQDLIDDLSQALESSLI
ncbi:MAG TPA: PLP-dependent aspartate aminotransferase family protein [Acidobacteriota bacterium]|nr:PLP-dependent aspartate aminotransferase family protein [Acidobacteriota bacterium]